MTPRRYLATTLTIDNRDHALLSESQQDEIHALRSDRRALKAELMSLLEELKFTRVERDAIAESLRQRDEQIAAWNDGREIR
jgi:hypothetical protein